MNQRIAKLNVRCQMSDVQSKSNGFTLIELLLYVGIASIILLVTSLFLSTLLQSRIKNQTIAEVEQQGLAVMQLITQTARNADSVNSPDTGASAVWCPWIPFGPGITQTRLIFASNTR